MRCTNCGAHIPEDELYCPRCGSEVRIVPDYNPLDDVLAKQVKGSIDGTTRPLDIYDDDNLYQTSSFTQPRRRPQQRRSDTGRQPAQRRSDTGRQPAQRRSDTGRQPAQRRSDTGRQPAQRRSDTGRQPQTGQSRRETEERRRQQAARKKQQAKKKRTRTIILLLVLLAFAGIICIIIYQNSYSTIIKKGNTALGQKDYSTANKYFNKAKDKDVTRAEAYTGLANVFVDQDDNDKAEQIFLEVIASQSSNTDIYKACIKFYIDTKQMGKIPILIDNCDDENVIQSLKEYTSDTPEFSLEEGSYDDVQEVSLSANKKSIYYTTDGSDPTTSSKKYSDAIQLDEGTTEIKAISVNKNNIPSMIAIKTYSVELPVEDAPAVTPSTGQHDAGTKISIDVPSGYTAYYTTDGSVPTSASSKYTDSVSMPNGKTIFKAVLINAKGKTTQITTRTYITD